MRYQAITTKYIGPSNVRGSRVKAIAEAGSVTLSWDHALNADGNHLAAAKALAEKMQWEGQWFGGAIAKTSGFAFVQSDIGSAPDFVTRDPRKAV